LEFVAGLVELEFASALEFVSAKEFVVGFVANIVEVELVGNWDNRSQGNYMDNTE